MRAGVLRDGAMLAAGRTAVDAVVWRHDGALRVTVIAKVSFAFADDAAMERTDPQPVFRAEVHHGQSPARSIRFAVDRVPYLNRGEVLFTGHAYAVAGTAVGMMQVRLGLFDGARALFDKTLLVRHQPGVESVPLVYERAFGGPGWADNPYGVGAVAGSGEADVIALEGGKHLAGFAPLGEAWTARKRRLGSTPRQALEGDVVEIPSGFDWAYFQAAPPDQWIDFPRGDEWIVMAGLHPALPQARMRLPGARGVARVYGLSAAGVAEGQPLALHADVLRIDGEEQRCSLTFRGVFPIADESALATLRVVAGIETPGEPIPWPDPAVLAAGRRWGSARQEPSSAPYPADEDGATMLSEEDLEQEPAEMFDGTLALGEATVQAIAQRPVVPFREGRASDSIAFGTGVPVTMGGTPKPPVTMGGTPKPPVTMGGTPKPPVTMGGTPKPPASREPSLLTVDLSGDAPVPAKTLPFRTRAVAPPPFVAPAPEPPPVVPAYVAEPPPPPRAPEPAPALPAPPPAASPSPPVAETRRGSPWAPAPEAPPPAARAPRPAPPKMQSPPSEALTKGLYGRFGGR